MIAHFFQTIHKLGLKTFKLTINTKKHDRQFFFKKILRIWRKKMNTFTYTNRKQNNRLYKNMSVTSLNHLDLKKTKTKSKERKEISL